MTSPVSVKLAGKFVSPSVMATPKSGWKNVDAWEGFRHTLPAGCVYRLRVVANDGIPLKLPRIGGVDNLGLLYIGETYSSKDSKRVVNLARGCCNTKYRKHGAANHLYDMGTHNALKKICKDYQLEIGWDEQTPYMGPTNNLDKNGNPIDATISTSAKEIGRLEKRKMLLEYSRTYGEFPPLNRKKGEFMRNKDQETGNSIDDCPASVEILQMPA